MKPPRLFAACCFFLLAHMPVHAFRASRFLQGLAPESSLAGDQAHAAQVLQRAVRGLTDWASKTASLQELDFMSRFKDWLEDHSSSLAGVETALDRLTGSVEWTDCATERSSCRCAGGAARYGRDGSWVYRNFSDGFDCSSEVFSRDPSPGNIKMCQCRGSTSRYWEWLDCGGEGRRCSCDGHLARYGANSGWVYKNFSGAFDCSNEGFAKDPSPGIVKTCQCQRPRRHPAPAGGSGATDGPLLWSCAEPPGAGAAAAALAEATLPLCRDERLAGLLEVHLDGRFQSGYDRWVNKTGWLDEAYVTYMAGKKNSNFEWMATNLIRSVNLFSKRPIVVVNFDKEFEPPESWQDFPNLIVYRMKRLPLGSQVSFNFNKIRAMIGARVLTGIQVDLDQVVFAGMDKVFQATRREVTQLYPYPILPVHWMARDGKPGEPYYAIRFTAYAGTRSMRWNHAHPTWSHWALPFLSQMLYERLTVVPEPPWMEEDEDMFNVLLWKKNVSKAWCKFDLEPDLFTGHLDANTYYDPHWYPDGVPLVFFGAHNTKHAEETDWLLTLMARCGEPSFRHQAHKCSATGANVCKRSLMLPSEMEQLFRASEEAATEVCCCVKEREDTPIFWQGRWYSDSSQVPTVDKLGRTRRCLMP